MSGHGTTDQDAQALAFLACRLRKETHGCREWDQPGTYSVIKSELLGKNLAYAVESVLCHATDPEAKTPGAIRRPFTPPKPSSKGPQRPEPLKAHEQCRRCSGQKGRCHCTREELAADCDEPTELPPLDQVNPNLAARLKKLAEPEEDACGA